MDNKKIRVRLCLKDIYRYMAIGETTKILGITEYSASNKEINIRFEGERRTRHFKAINEDARKKAIKIINKHIQEVH